MEQLKLVYVGIGGYGVTNLDQYLSGRLEGTTIAGVVDVNPSSSFFYNRLVEMNVPFYSSLEEFYEKDTADLAVISTPIQFHAPQSIYAMRHGSNVICEKPVSSTVEEAQEMLKVSEETGRFINIGYQASYSPATLAFKADVTAGVLGKPLYAKTVCLWPRTETYYGRSPWAGKLKGPNGEWILDSVANNATAHYLHNMFYVLGGGDDKALIPDSVEFELYRGNNIESFDTCAMRAMCGDIPVLFLSTHIVRNSFGPQIEFGFENATVSVLDHNGDILVAKFKDGSEKVYGNFQEGREGKLQRSVAQCRGEANAVCTVKASMSHALIIREFHRDPAYIHSAETVVAETKDGILHYMPGLDEDMKKCFAENKLPSELGMSWSRGTVKAIVEK